LIIKPAGDYRNQLLSLSEPEQSFVDSTVQSMFMSAIFLGHLNVDWDTQEKNNFMQFPIKCNCKSGKNQLKKMTYYLLK
jgi:hypothetical protein